jgi:hypothetical protein
MKLYNLESVGAVVNEAGIAYPMNEDGTPDLANGTDLCDIEADEWWKALSNEDSYTAMGIQNDRIDRLGLGDN